MTAADDAGHLARARRLAARGLYTTDPNPRVGCVIVKDGEVVAEGWHERAGGPHAERMALDIAGDASRGATAYVSLEPCSFAGRTAACTEALIDAGVVRVVCRGIDPNPKVSGRGIDQLRAAGLQVDVVGSLSTSDDDNPGYVSRMTRGRPWVRSKLAASLDGRTALANGLSQWITGSASRADVHRWRARSSAVLTGVDTLLADDPRLNARLEDPATEVKQPLRVILDSKLRTRPDAKALGSADDALIFTTSGESAVADALSRRASIERVGGSGRCDLIEVLEALGKREINELWVEAGAVLNGALLREGLIDEVIVYLAPHVMGSSARGMFALDSLVEMEQRIGLEFTDVRRVEDDLRVVARPRTLAGP